MYAMKNYYYLLSAVNDFVMENCKFIAVIKISIMYGVKSQPK